MSDRRLHVSLLGSNLEHRLPDHHPGQVHSFPLHPLMLACQLPQAGEGDRQVDQKGAAEDGGGEEQGGGQAAFAGAVGAICAHIAWKGIDG